MMSKAIVLAVCQFLAQTELVSEERGRRDPRDYYQPFLDYAYESDCVYLDAETGREVACADWELELMEGEEPEVNWDREVSGEGEWRFDPDTSSWVWEGPTFELRDLRYIPDEDEEEEERTEWYFPEEDGDEEVWMTEPQETWVEWEPNMEYYPHSAPAEAEEEASTGEEARVETSAEVVEEEERQMETSYETSEGDKLSAIKSQFERLLKKGYLVNSPAIDDLMSGKFDYLLQPKGEAEYCGNIPEFYYRCAEWADQEEDTQPAPAEKPDLTEYSCGLVPVYYYPFESECQTRPMGPLPRPVPWPQARKPLAAPYKRPTYHRSEGTQCELEERREMVSIGGGTYAVLRVGDVQVRDFVDEEDAEGWYEYDEDTDEYNYVWY